MKRILTAVAVLASIAAGSYALAETTGKAGRGCAGPCSGCQAQATHELTEQEYFSR